jgi:hypothetical protein
MLQLRMRGDFSEKVSANKRRLYCYSRPITLDKRGQHVNKFGGLVGLTYMIITTEQMVARNAEVRDTLQEWSYGQTLALIMLAQQILDCATYLKQSNRVREEEDRLNRNHPTV